MKMNFKLKLSIKSDGSGGIRTHAPEETGALNQRLRPLGHATLVFKIWNKFKKREIFTFSGGVYNRRSHEQNGKRSSASESSFN